jgi:hypothetical protein
MPSESWSPSSELPAAAAGENKKRGWESSVHRETLLTRMGARIRLGATAACGSHSQLGTLGPGHVAVRTLASVVASTIRRWNRLSCSGGAKPSPITLISCSSTPSSSFTRTMNASKALPTARTVCRMPRSGVRGQAGHRGHTPAKHLDAHGTMIDAAASPPAANSRDGSGQGATLAGPVALV